MPLSALVRQLQRVPLTGEVHARIARSDRLRLSGAGQQRPGRCGRCTTAGDCAHLGGGRSLGCPA